MFSFNLGGTDEESKVIFGGYDLAKYSKKKAPLAWIPLIDANYWTIRLGAAKLGSYTFDLDT